MELDHQTACYNWWSGNVPPSDNQVVAELWDGSSWTEVGDNLNTATRGGGAGIWTVQHCYALSVGGRVMHQMTPVSKSNESWNGNVLDRT